MRPEYAGHPRKVGIYVEHPAIVMAEHPHPVPTHRGGYTGRFDPRSDLLPDGLLGQVSGHDVVFQSQPVEHAGHFRHRAGLAVRQPLAGHPTAVAHAVQVIVVDRRGGLQVQHDHRHAEPLHHRQHRRRQRVSRYVQEHQFHIVFFQPPRGGVRFRRVVHHPGVDHLGPHAAHFFRDLPLVALQTFQQTVELPPISIQSDSKKSDFHVFLFVFKK